MRTRSSWAVVFLLAGCFESEDPPAPACDDVDGDGVCAEDDCDDADASRAATCDDDPCLRDAEAEGCPCGDGEQNPACYDGDPAHAGVGSCSLGIRVCNGGRWTGCQGQGFPTDEVCNGQDEDCDAEPDDGVLSPCGDCDPTCRNPCVGVGCTAGFVAGPGADLDGEGALVVNAEADLTPRVIWLDSHFYGAVAKVDTATFTMGAQYRVTAESNFATMGAVVMDAYGDAYVAISGVTDALVKVKASACDDLDGDGAVETAEPGEGPLAYGEDECVAWSEPLPACGACLADAVAALTEYGRMVWAGRETLAELDAETGEVTGREVELDDPALSLVADQRSYLWALTADDLIRIDVSDLAVDDRASVARGAVGRLDFDADGRVWIVGEDDELMAFDPLFRTGLVLQDFVIVEDSAWGLSFSVNEQELLEIDLAAGAAAGAETGVWALAIAADLQGNLWTTRPGGPEVRAYEVEGGSATEALVWQDTDLCGVAGACIMPRFRGDPAAVRFRRAFGETAPGTSTGMLFDTECADPSALTLRWETNGEGRVWLSMRTAGTEDALARTPWLAVGSTPPAQGTKDLRAVLSERHRPAGRFVEVMVELRGDEASLRRVELTSRCGG